MATARNSSFKIFAAVKGNLIEEQVYFALKLGVQIRRKIAQEWHLRVQYAALLVGQGCSEELFAMLMLAPFAKGDIGADAQDRGEGEKKWHRA